MGDVEALAVWTLCLILGLAAGLTVMLILGGLFLASWLLYHLFALVIIPLCVWIWQEEGRVPELLSAWYREVTWQRRTMRIRDETLAAIDAVCQRHVARVREMAEELDHGNGDKP
jgi:hypothetical protein